MSNAFEVTVLCVASNFAIGTTFTRGAMSILSFNRQIHFWSNTKFNPPFYLNDFQNSDFTSSFNSQTMALKSACSAHLLTEIFRLNLWLEAHSIWVQLCLRLPFYKLKSKTKPSTVFVSFPLLIQFGIDVWRYNILVAGRREKQGNTLKHIK